MALTIWSWVRGYGTFSLLLSFRRGLRFRLLEGHGLESWHRELVLRVNVGQVRRARDREVSRTLDVEVGWARGVEALETRLGRTPRLPLPHLNVVFHLLLVPHAPDHDPV